MPSYYPIAFARLKEQRRIGFCPFAVLGDPDEKECLARIKKYMDAKPDFLELGIPFSDPVADGPTIQAADERALKAGMTPKKAIRLVAKIRALSDVPIGVLTYSNIVLRYGVEKFYRDLKNVGADSVLVADAPLEEIKPFANAARKYKLAQIMLVSEHTDCARLKKIEKIVRGGAPKSSVKNSGGFLYVVSTLGVTGARKNLDPKILFLIKTLKKKSRLPLMVGFGISQPQHIQQLKKAGANGAIIGSALVKMSTKKISRLLSELNAACT